MVSEAGYQSSPARSWETTMPVAGSKTSEGPADFAWAATAAKAIAAAKEMMRKKTVKMRSMKFNGFCRPEVPG